MNLDCRDLTKSHERKDKRGYNFDNETNHGGYNNSSGGPSIPRQEGWLPDRRVGSADRKVGSTDMKVCSADRRVVSQQEDKFP